MLTFVALRDLLIFVLGVWFFEFYLDYKLPAENNLLIFFVAIPIIWSTLTQLWTSYSYREATTWWFILISHLLSVLMLTSTVFLVSAVLNTIEDSLDATGNILFHGVGWTVILAMVIYDIIDVSRSNR